MLDEYTLLQDSILNTDRYSGVSRNPWDPRDFLNITEESLNALLINVTISALSLNTWFDSVNVTDTRFRNVYRFSNPLNFFLPYGLCLGLTVLCIGLGLVALNSNGTSATDGGFLQIMMTTRGDTTMSRCVEGASLGGKENAPQALLNLKVRFGELIRENKTTSTRKYGFGTMEETVVLKKTR